MKKTKNFNIYLQKRLTKEEIAQVVRMARMAVAEIPNAKTKRILDNCDKGIGLNSCKDVKDFYKQLEI